MNQLTPHKTGLALGAFAGGMHLLWSILVVIGFAQSLVDFIFTLHMIESVYVIAPFSLALAGTLVVVTAIVGYAVGYVFAHVWNRVAR